jgi:hypothetical protein
MITTLCRDCVFATFVGNTQFDCKLNRLKTLQQNGAELTLKEENGRRFYSINRLCNTCRNGEWAKDKSPYKLEEIVRKEIELKCDIILFTDELENPKNLEIPLKSISNSSLLPSSVIILLDKYIKPIPIIKILENMPYNWQIIQDSENRSFIEKIQEAVEKGVGDWYCILNSTSKLPENTLEDMNEDINDRLQRYISLRHEDFTIYSKSIHRVLGGFLWTKIEEDKWISNLDDKIDYIADKNNSHHMIKNLCTTTSR